MLKDIGNYRELKVINASKEIIDFSSNDYLLLSNNKDLQSLAANAFSEDGIGSSGSRLLSGNKNVFAEIEKKIAFDKGSESALVFNSGFQANISVIPALTEYFEDSDKTLVFSDFLNHASINYGLKISRANVIKYNHSIEHLCKKLEKYKFSNNRKFIVTETVFGMSGDVIDLPKFIELAFKNNALLYLDEAHATGVLGRNGYGLSTLYPNLQNISSVIMGTFSKALGSFGAYVACSKTIKKYLVNRCAGFIYSTALPPAMVKVIHSSWNKIGSMNEERNCLLKKASILRDRLRFFGLKVGGVGTNIIPIFINGDVVGLSKNLLDHGFLVSAIRPPTVPQNSKCLRLSLNIGHTEENILEFANFVQSKINMFL